MEIKKDIPVEPQFVEETRLRMLKGIQATMEADIIRGHPATAGEMVIEGKAEDKKPSWVRKTWQELKSLGRTAFPVIAPPSGHAGAVNGPKIEGKRRWRKANHHERSTSSMTNHERVVMGRARRMRISVAEYRRRFGGEHVS